MMMASGAKMYQLTRGDIANEGVYLAHGLRVIGAGRNPMRRLFHSISCGHDQEVDVGCAQSGSFRCQTCQTIGWQKDASSVGLTFLEKAGGHYARYRFNDCGHEQEIQYGSARDGRFRCKTCLSQKHHEEAFAAGLTLHNTFFKGQTFGNYTFNKCGHSQTIALSDVRKGRFQCQGCEETWATRPSNLYLHLIKYGEIELLKFGRARDVDRRSVQYGLPVGAVLEILQVWPTETGIEADRIESIVSKQFKQYSKSKAKMVLQDSGWTECYNVDDKRAIVDFVDLQIDLQ